MKKFIILNILIFASGYAWDDEVAIIKNMHSKKKNIATSTLQGSDQKIYQADNTFDWDVKTAWCTGKKPEGESIASSAIGSSKYGNYGNLKKINYLYKSILVIFNGYGKSKETYYNNNRIKKATLKIYEARMGDALSGSFFEKSPTFVFKKSFYFKDEPNIQLFNLDFELKDRPKEKQVDELGLFYVFIIDEVYEGKKYKDTCISELGVYGAFNEEDENYYKKMNGLK
ncbi:NADase-type glycan-binding domain-containing protein [Leptospira noguchii]|uniref:NAD glycohydrolase translocation F5/8 type C domain-containing protein n=1 Tax=Leptospira noguchii str. 2007001578 TaxID=1049974 RepID=A0ABP2T253_9LEPT|nr:hypothetical protein [Leptospira noguchii]EMM98363.1 hypothetical protein LEP1GSC035_0124 [Leptospira noguchii str. 2007001578]